MASSVLLTFGKHLTFGKRLPFFILTMFVFTFDVESLKQSVYLGRLVIFDNQKVVLFTVFSLLELFFGCYIVVAVAKENLLNTPTFRSRNFQRIQRLWHPKLAFDWLSVCFFEFWPIRMSGLLLLCTELTLFCIELPENCIYLNQSERSNFFMHIIIEERSLRPSREEVCRKIFVNIFNEKFSNVRPLWLMNHQTGFLLE